MLEATVPGAAAATGGGLAAVRAAVPAAAVTRDGGRRAAARGDRGSKAAARATSGGHWRWQRRRRDAGEMAAVEAAAVEAKTAAAATASARAAACRARGSRGGAAPSHPRRRAVGRAEREGDAALRRVDGEDDGAQAAREGGACGAGTCGAGSCAYDAGVQGRAWARLALSPSNALRAPPVLLLLCVLLRLALLLLSLLHTARGGRSLCAVSTQGVCGCGALVCVHSYSGTNHYWDCLRKMHLVLVDANCAVVKIILT